jgi:predicted aminopeptidase
MKDYSAYALADLIIHELLHATVFVKGQVQFNEQLAEFVGSTGARLYIESRYGPDSPEYREIGSGAADRAAFRNVVSALIAELEILYAGNLNREEKLSEKARIIKAAQERFVSEYDNLFSGENYRNFAELPVNNAYLDLYRLYYEKDSFFADLYAGIPDPAETGIIPADPAKAQIRRLKVLITTASSLPVSARKNPRAEMEKALAGQ